MSLPLASRACGEIALAARPEIIEGAVPLAKGELSDAEIERVEARLSRLATALDSAFSIPFTGIRFGADAVIGLVPAAGDLVGAGLSAYIIMEARRIGVPKRVIARMAGNVAVDTAVGAVPLLGSVFDVFYKANRRNIALLREHLDEVRRSRPRVVGSASTARPRR